MNLRASLGLYVPRPTLASAANVAAPKETNMTQQWPNETTPATPGQNAPGEAPAAPHTPQAPRQTPEPRDPDSGAPDTDSESE